MLIPTTEVINNATRPLKAWSGFTFMNKEPFLYTKSSKARISILKILLPRRFPTAISTLPILTAAIETTNSGSDVVAATNKVPMKDLFIPVWSARWSAKYGKAMAAATINSANKTYRLMANWRNIFFRVMNKCGSILILCDRMSVFIFVNNPYRNEIYNDNQNRSASKPKKLWDYRGKY